MTNPSLPSMKSETGNSMFIPPEGAMQYVFDKFPECPIWVYPRMVKLDRNLHCTCVEGMPVVEGSEDAAGLEFSTPDYMTANVCLCQGHLIE